MLLVIILTILSLAAGCWTGYYMNPGLGYHSGGGLSSDTADRPCLLINWQGTAANIRLRVMLRNFCIPSCRAKSVSNP